MSSHTDLQQLIPWYVNGTLGESDQDRMNQHLEDCAVCREHVRHEMAFARLVCTPPPGLDRVDHAAGRTRLLAALPQRSGRQRLRPLAAAAALVVTVAVTAFVVGQRTGAPAYRTLTAPVAADVPVLQLVFSPTASEASVQAALRTADGRVLTAGEDGMTYRIALPGEQDGRALARRLRGHPGVRWAAVEAP